MGNNNSHNSSLHFVVLATDIVCFRIVNGGLQVLLGEVTNESYRGKYACIGGLIRPNETAVQAIDRLLVDKAGVKGVYKEQLYTFDALDRDVRGRVVAVAYIAIAQHAVEDTSSASVKTQWVSIKKVPTLAYDHNEIVKVAIERLRSRFAYTNIVQYFLPIKFTLTDLQEIYEIVLDQTFDKRNFRKKILASDILKETGENHRDGIMRPAALYTFKTKEIKNISMI